MANSNAKRAQTVASNPKNAERPSNIKKVFGTPKKQK